MRLRRIAVLIDGGFFLKRLSKLVESRFCSSPQQVADTARHLCKRHVQRLVGLDTDADSDGRWLDHVYRLFYYDATPFEGVAHHPLANQRIEFGKTGLALFRQQLFSELRRKRKFALRLGHVGKEGDWKIATRLTKQLLKTRRWMDRIEDVLLNGAAAAPLDAQETSDLRALLTAWRGLERDDVRLGLRQKGVDMRIGLDIASITLKQQAYTFILVTGDSDFVPAAKLARREGVEFLLDPLWQQVGDDLHEHVDGIVSVFPRPIDPSQAPSRDEH